MRPQPSRYRPDPAILAIADIIGDTVAPARFPRHILRFRNQRWASAVGLDHLDDPAWIRHFAGFEPLPDNLPAPLALRYHGHQFRIYNPDLGDGRGFLFAQLRDDARRLLDLGTKGSGTTPYSRSGDGRLTLKGGVREVLATEMLEALGVETSKSFSLIETGEALDRGDEPSPTRSSVLVRLGHGHIRIGSFQRLAAIGDAGAMRRLAAYVLEHLYGEAPGEDAALRLLELVAGRAARLAASYMAAGFVHGVLNSDNIAITAESFDYGPWRFTPTWDPDYTASYFDHHGLYCFARQPQAIHWNLVQLGGALQLLSPFEVMAPILETFPELYEAEFALALSNRLGVAPDAALAPLIVDALEQSAVGIDRFFFDWRGGRLRRESMLYSHPSFAPLRAALDALPPAATPDHPYWDDTEPCSMHIDEVEAIWERIDAADDWSAFNAKIEAIRRMGDAMAATRTTGTET